jgi:endoglucanase
MRLRGGHLLRVEGTQLCTAGGERVTLRGVGLGGWMNMENFITGYPSAELLLRKALRKTMGDEAYKAFFDRFLDVFFSSADAAYLSSLGLNCVRLPVNYRHFEDDSRPFEAIEEGFAILSRAVERCAEQELYAIIDLHSAQGWQNQRWHSDNPTHWALLWSHRHFQDRVVWLWEQLAERFRGNEWVAGYNLINEPGDVGGEVIAPLYRRLHDAIRQIDPDHVLFLEGNRYALDFDAFGEPLENCVYSTHDYALPGFVDGGEYPGLSRGEYVDRGVVERTFADRTRYQRATQTPIWVGEFGPVYSGDPHVDEMRYRLLADQLEIYAANDVSWTLWTYKDIGLQGLVYAADQSAYMERIAPVLAKKSRLAVDGWGTTDEPVRHLLEPLEHVVRSEFPDFEPFPWGQRAWVHQIVRHMLFAEPMVDDFAACFAGVTAADARAAADSFSFENCERRERLAEMLQQSATPT